LRADTPSQYHPASSSNLSLTASAGARAVSAKFTCTPRAAQTNASEWAEVFEAKESDVALGR
jgi:hypothetical protein